SVRNSILIGKIGLSLGSAAIVTLSVLVAAGNSSRLEPLNSPRAHRSLDAGRSFGDSVGKISAMAGHDQNRVMMLTVLDAEDQHSLSNVQIMGRSDSVKSDLQTDAKGLAMIAVPTTEQDDVNSWRGFTVWVSIGGYVPKKIEWNKNE